MAKADRTTRAKTTQAPSKPLAAAPQAAGPATAIDVLELQCAAENPLAAPAQAMLKLQRAYGNRAVGAAIQRATIGAGGGELDGATQNAIDSARGEGQSLDSAVGAQVGGALGADFSGVKVHTDSHADALNRSLSAKAFTTGSDIFFSAGAYQPNTTGGNRLLAHELTHVVQQGSAKPNKAQRSPSGAIHANQYKSNKLQAKLKPNTAAAPLPHFSIHTAAAIAPVKRMIQRTTAEWLKGSFGFPDVTQMHEFRAKIGEEAFQGLLKYENSQITPLIPYLKAQTPPALVRPLDQLALLVPLANSPDLPLMEQALTLAQHDRTAAVLIKDYLAKYRAKGVKILALAEKILKDNGRDAVVAEQAMSELEGYNYEESLKTKVAELGNRKAQDEHDSAAADNKQKRETYIEDYTSDKNNVDPTEPDVNITELLGNLRATSEYDQGVAQTIVDRQSFEAAFLKETGVAHTKTFTKNEVTKIGPISKGLAKIFPGEDFSSVSKTKELIDVKLAALENRKNLLDSGLEGNKAKYKLEVAKKLGQFEATSSKLGVDLGANKLKYKEAPRQAIMPLFALPDSEVVAQWVLTTAGSDDKKAISLATWILNGSKAGITWPNIQKILGGFTLTELAAFHAPASGDDPKAKALLKLLVNAKPGEQAKFATLISRDDDEDFGELLKLYKEATSDIDITLTIFSKADSSKDINTLLAKLKAPTVDHLGQGRDYLQHKGKAADATFLKAKAISQPHSELLLAKDWIVGHGEEVAHIYGKAANNVTRTIEVLDILEGATVPKTPKDVKKWLDLNHTFTNIYNKLQADNNQQFWADEKMAESGVPVTSRLGVNDNVNTVVANATGGKTVGQFYRGGNFGNGGNGFGQPKGMILPDNVGYTEYDVKPYKEDSLRGKNRIVIGGGNYYFTSNHYETFTRFRP